MSFASYKGCKRLKYRVMSGGMGVCRCRGKPSSRAQAVSAAMDGGETQQDRLDGFRVLGFRVQGEFRSQES